jgi:hypothetical protein
MRPSRFRVDSVATATLAIYFAAWFAVLGAAAGWILAAITATGHLAAQLAALLRKGHMGLSAEPLALPVALMTHAAGIALLRHAGHSEVLRTHWLELAIPLGSAWVAGHACAFGCAALVDWWQRRRQRSA